MDMKLIGPLIVVEDLQRAKKFYEELLGQRVKFDLGANQQYESGLMMQTRATWGELTTLPGDAYGTGSNNLELYFETGDIDEFLKALELWQVELVHPVKEFPWGQRCVAFYDPDGYIVEVGESLESVCRRFLQQGKTVEEVVAITELPADFVTACRWNGSGLIV